jgi:DNA-binding Lrp family transcriptional regulator
MRRDASIVLEMIAGHPDGVTATEIAQKLQADPIAVGDCIQYLRESDEILGVGGVWFTPGNWSAWVDSWTKALAHAHKENPTAPLVPAAKIIGFTGKPLVRAVDALERSGLIRRRGTDIALAAFRPQLPAKQKVMVEKVVEHIGAASPRFLPPHRISAELGVPLQAIERAIDLAMDAGELMALGDRFVATRAETALMVTACLQLPSPFTISDFRDLTMLTRKDATVHLDNWDERGVTWRGEDDRRKFSEEFQQRLRDIRLTHDDAAD